MKFKEGAGHTHPIRVAAIDLDGTLLNTKKTLGDVSNVIKANNNRFDY